MSKKLTVIPEQCSGCSICELVCAIKHFGVNNPKKAAIRVLITYPHPVMRMPVVCSQCHVPACAQVCPTDALQLVDGIVQLDEESYISCFKCVEACPFGAIYAHEDSTWTTIHATDLTDPDEIEDEIIADSFEELDLMLEHTKRIS